MFRKTFSLFLVLSAACTASAYNSYWEGDESSNWSTAGNWSLGLPGSTDKATIPGLTTTGVAYPVFNDTRDAYGVDIGRDRYGSVGNGNATLTIAGGTLSVVGGKQVYLYTLYGGKLIMNAGTLKLSSSIWGIGASGRAYIDMTGGLITSIAGTNNTLMLCHSTQDDGITMTMSGGEVTLQDLFMNANSILNMSVNSDAVIKLNYVSGYGGTDYAAWKTKILGYADRITNEVIDINDTTHIITITAVQAVEPDFTNFIGMNFVQVDAGTFTMGTGPGGVPINILWTIEWGNNGPIVLPYEGHYDEYPVHEVNITESFYVGMYEVTNAQYEQFDPNHGNIEHYGFTHGPNEAVMLVSWEDANAFCAWLNANDPNKPEGLVYRLPTEAEWEYACRAGTTTHFSNTTTDGNLPSEYLKNPNLYPGPYPVSLAVGQTTSNPWGIYDMHGNVEEWCYDWYGPYQSGSQTDPLGRQDGIFKVSRGGSHETVMYYLRSSNRLGALPDEKTWLIGFRVVLGEPLTTEPLGEPNTPLWAEDVNQSSYDWSNGPDSDKPYFAGPITYTKVEPNSWGPFYSSENHNPSISWCNNGDIFVQWMTTTREWGREKAYLATRLRPDSNEWTDPAEFLKPPDRCMQGTDLITDQQGKIYSFKAHSPGGGKDYITLTLQTSEDNGASWSKPKVIQPLSNSPTSAPSSAFIKSTGEIILPVDSLGDGNSTIRVSNDDGNSWPLANGTLFGVHPGVVELKDGNLMALTRTNLLLDKMPKSISDDMGESWTQSSTEFPPIATGQRLVLIRLRQGPILLVTFSSRLNTYYYLDGRQFSRNLSSWPIPDQYGDIRDANGMFAALSFDEGETWPVKRLLTPGEPCQLWYGEGHTHWFRTDGNNAETAGYLAATQSPAGVIHLISSALHYRFNLAWLMESLTIDNFERYNNTAELGTKWQDNAGATVSLSTNPVHDGNNAMKFDYDNGASPFYSEIVRTYSTNTRDWTIAGIKSLDLWFRGDAGNAVEQMYFVVEDSNGNDAIVNYGDSNDIKNAQWQLWRIDLQEIADAGVNLKYVKKVYIGFGDRSSPLAGGSGTVYFDDIDLLWPKCLNGFGPAGDLNCDCVVDFADVKIIAEDWLDSGYTSVANLYSDNTVNLLDFAVLADHWLESSIGP